jgi:hypothetical protein
MKNYWLDKNKKSFNQKMLDEAKQLEKVWTKMGIIDMLGGPTRKGTATSLGILKGVLTCLLEKKTLDVGLASSSSCLLCLL